MAIDHKEEKKKAEKEGRKVKYKGVIFFDSPKDYAKIHSTNPVISIQGWKLCDCDDCEFNIYVGNIKLTNFSYRQRQDVMAIYTEEFSGLVNEDKVGWKVDVNLLECMDQLREDNTFLIRAELRQKNGTLIDEETTVILYEEENS